ncbi:NAD(P)/FAD-dependent oxidoreductase [Sphaerimonospora sp. CA-214678]|uniref:NAD(P)/FAD-dependent oxidoreductase n=1 Tax=Sphaerimonospora sp. CA-214678 TaxID=3240029 RepID=UPI003D8FDB7C
MSYDVIVVGARCAGAPTAMLFARAGYRVLLLDRAKPGADTLSTLYIQQPGVARLARWGLLDAVRASGCPPLERVVYRMGADLRLEGCAGPLDGNRAAYAPRRHILDPILVEGAVAAGAEFRDRCPVEGLLMEDDRVAGVRFTDPDGRTQEARARLVVGADGMRSTVAELAGAATTIEHPRLTCAYYSYWNPVQADFELYEGETGWVSAVPTNDAVLVSAYFPQDRFHEVRGRAQDAYIENIRDNAPDLFARLAGAEQVDRLHGTGDQRNFFRQPAGPGWVLVGDAGHHKDSLTARGIGDAFWQAELLVGLVGDGLADPGRLESALKAFAEERDRELMDVYMGTLLVARAEARDKRRALLRAVGTSPELTQRYFDTVAGISPLKQLYTPELLALLADG